MALDGLQAKLRDLEAELRKRTRQNHKVNMIRYADDFIITGCSQEMLRDKVQFMVADFLRERGLELSPEKTRITPMPLT